MDTTDINPPLPAAPAAAEPSPSLAERIDRLLVHAIGIGIDPQRLLGDALYRRDVLLVCDAIDDAAGPQLAAALRADLGLADPSAAHPARGPSRAERRRIGRRDRRRGRGGQGDVPAGRERRRAQRRALDRHTAQATGPASAQFDSGVGADRSRRSGDAEIAAEAAHPAPSKMKRWFQRRAGKLRPG